MEMECFFGEENQLDESWQIARNVTKRAFHISENIYQMSRRSWQGTLELNEFKKMLGFSGISANCLLRAAEINREEYSPAIGHVDDAIRSLGIRYSSVVMGVGATVSSILQCKPEYGWKSLLVDMMDEMEIGYRLGSRVSQIGIEAGVLLGFSRLAGVGVLLSVDKGLFRKYSNVIKNDGEEAKKLFIESVGCEPYQVTAFILQRLGLGVDFSIGIACALGGVHIDDPAIAGAIKHWSSAYSWLTALRDGRNYPGDVEFRNYFQELRTVSSGSNSGQKNVTLEVLYTEVAKVRTEGSKWNWHLPKAGYEETREALGL